MEWLLVILALAIGIGAIFLNPDLLTPDCPVCGGPMIPARTPKSSVVHEPYPVVWREIFCPQCWYTQRQIWIEHRSEESKP